MASDSFHGKLAEIGVTLEVLEQKTKVAESYKVLLSSKTEGYISAIQAEKSPYSDTSFHITNWFRNFIGVKDEAMLLINGEIIRNYHVKFHKKYFHERGNEQRYYTSKAEFLGLSSCCADGLLYEIRAIERKFKKQADREGDRVDILANRVQDIEMRLDSLCKYFDSYAALFQKELKRGVPHVKSITLEITHKSENLSVQYHKDLTNCADFSCSSKGARTGSRKQALYSGIEERTTQAEAVQHTTCTTNHSNGIGTFRSKMTVADAEDEADLRKRLQQRAQQEKLQRQAAELEAAKGPDFGFDFSIDQTKLQAGAFELMAVPVDPLARMATDGRVSIESEAVSTTPQTNKPWSLQAEPLNPELAALRVSHLMKVKVCANNTAVSSADVGQLSRTKLSGTSIVVTSSSSSSTSSSSASAAADNNYSNRGGVTQAYLSVAASATLNFAELKDRTSGNSGVLVEEVLRDVTRQLWLAAPFAARGKPAMDFYICLPISISINATKYSAGDCMQLPSAEDLAEKRYLVKTDDRPCSILFLNSVAKWLGTFDQEDAFIEAKQQLSSLLPLVQRLCDCFCNSAAPLDLLSLSHLAAIAAAPIPAVHADTTCTSKSTSYFEKLLQLAEPLWTEPDALCVTVSESAQWCASFPALLENASRLDAAACGLTCIDLLQAVDHVERHCISTITSTSTSPIGGPSDASYEGSRRVLANSLPSLQVLNLQHNGSLLSYVDHPWEQSLHDSPAVASHTSEAVQIDEEPESEPMDIDLSTYCTHGNNNSSNNNNTDSSSGGSDDPFERFAVCLLIRAGKLRELDLSYCATSAKQATALSHGLVAALTAREAAGLTPLEKVVLKGLETYPGVVPDLRRRLLVSTTGTMAGVRAIDAAGFNLTI